MAGDNKNGFMKGAAILSVSTLVVKALGLLFSIPLANFISAEGMSYFYGAYDIFTVFLMLSTAGLPIAVSRMVGTAHAMGRRKEADQVFSVAFWLFFGIGLLGCLVMVFGARQIADLLGKPGAYGTIVALAPTVFFISITSAIRGYFQGRSNMVPTAVSQVIEAVLKVAVGIGLAYYIIYKYNSDVWAAVGAITGVSVSSGLGMVYLSFYMLRQRRRDRALPEDEHAASGRRDMLMSLLRFAVPITLGSCFLSVLDFVDSAVLMDRMKMAAGFTQSQADWYSGVLGNARKFFDLPGSFVVPISTSLLPVLSGAIAAGDRPQVRHISSMSMRMTLLISIPASVGMSIFAEPICQHGLYHQRHAPVLRQDHPAGDKYGRGGRREDRDILFPGGHTGDKRNGLCHKHGGRVPCDSGNEHYRHQGEYAKHGQRYRHGGPNAGLGGAYGRGVIRGVSGAYPVFVPKAGADTGHCGGYSGVCRVRGAV